MTETERKTLVRKGGTAKTYSNYSECPSNPTDDDYYQDSGGSYSRCKLVTSSG
nr:hypothetical protein [Candidatus Mycoplasma haematolamae]